MLLLLSHFLNPNDSIQQWLTSPLPLVAVPGASEALLAPVSPASLPALADVTEAAPVVNKARQSAKASGSRKAMDKTTRRRSPKTAAAAR